MKENNNDKNWFMKHKVLTAILAVVLISVIGITAGGGSKSSTDNSTGNSSSSSNTAQKEETAATPKIGVPVRDGKFEFTVKSLECGKSTVGDNQYLTQQAQGQYCLLSLNVKNIGDAQQLFLDMDQKLLNAEGLEYKSDSVATLYNANNQNVFATQINPGNSVEGVLVFDIPKDQVPVTAELHDSSLSSGIKIDLKQ